MRQTLGPAPRGGAYAVLPRMLSLLTAIALAGMVLAYPRALAWPLMGMRLWLLLLRG